MNKEIQNYESDDSFNLQNEIIRYISFWPYFLVLFIILFTSTFFIPQIYDASYKPPQLKF